MSGDVVNGLMVVHCVDPVSVGAPMREHSNGPSGGCNLIFQHCNGPVSTTPLHMRGTWAGEVEGVR